MKKEWKVFKNVDCPNCGNDVLVLSEIPGHHDPEKDLVFDDEECKCAGDCGWKGHTVVDDDNAFLNDGNIDELPDEG